MRLAVLDLCVWLPEYQADQARFGDLLAGWAARALPEARFTVIDVTGGAPLPPVPDFDGYILSGSEKGVYDDAPWMQPLRAFLPEARAAGKPLFGVCFGHQIMADVFGGKAEKVGPQQVGPRAYAFGDQTLDAHAWHQDQVTRVPPGATVIGQADYCPVAALAYDFPAMSVQFHPEYPVDYLTTLIARSRGDVLSEAETDAALAALATSTVPEDVFARQLATFFRTALG